MTSRAWMVERKGYRFHDTYAGDGTPGQWRTDCIHVGIAPEGQMRGRKTMAKKTLKKSKKLESTKPLNRP